jgi:hypothetical protein
MIITAFNPETADLEKSYLANPYSIGVTSITVKNNDRFTTNDRVLIGEMGHEKTEIVTASAISADGLTLTIGATLFTHEADTPVYKLRFDQVKFYRSTTGINGTYSVIATVALDVDNENLTTIYDDTSGTAIYYYKTTVYHSIAAVESDYSDPISGGGYSRNQVGYIIDEILQEVGDPNELNVTRNELIGYFNDVNDDLTIYASRPFDFLRTRTALTRTADTKTLNFPTDSNGDQSMWKFDRMDYNYTDSGGTDTTYTLKVIPTDEYRNTYIDNTIDSTTVSDAIDVISLDTAVDKFRFHPPAETTGAAAFYLYYWKFFDRIDSEGDKIETPTPKIYKLYCKGMYYRKKGVTESSYLQISDRYMADYNIEKAKLRSADRIDRGTPRSFRPATTITDSYRR